MKKYLIAICFLLITQLTVASGNGWINVLDEGANNKGKKCTEKLQKAIDKAAAKGGGTLYFPAGEYLTGALHLKSNITLYIDAGALLKFSDDFDDYLPFVQLRWEGTVMNSFSPLLYAKDAENITITGRGTIDGQGKKWWLEMYRIETAKEELELTKYQKMWMEQNKGLETAPYYQRTMNIRFFRPPLFQTFQCKNVTIEGVTIQNSPFWTVDPAFCDNVTIHNVTIFNPPSPNTDGINPTSCKNVHISDCHISVGDDCITIKSGRDMDGRKWNMATENVTITNCTMLSGHGGVVIGSEMSGGIKKITISNCVFDGTDRGIRIKTARGRGGVIEDIRVDNIVMNNIKQEAIKFNMFYDKNTVVEEVSERTPTIKNIHISNITGTNINKAGYIAGIEEMPVNSVSFSNITMDAKEGFSVTVAKNIEFHDVQVNTTMGSAFEMENVANIVLDNVKSATPLIGKPVIKLKNVQNAALYNNFQMEATDVFVEVEGDKTENVIIKNNLFDHVKTPVVKSKSLQEGAVKE